MRPKFGTQSGMVLPFSVVLLLIVAVVVLDVPAAVAIAVLVAVVAAAVVCRANRKMFGPSPRRLCFVLMASRCKELLVVRVLLGFLSRLLDAFVVLCKRRHIGNLTLLRVKVRFFGLVSVELVSVLPYRRLCIERLLSFV